MRTLQALGGLGSFFCFKLAGSLSPLTATFSGLGEPGLEARFNMLLASTLVAGTVVIGTDINALVRTSVAGCWIAEWDRLFLLACDWKMSCRLEPLKYLSSPDGDLSGSSAPQSDSSISAAALVSSSLAISWSRWLEADHVHLGLRDLEGSSWVQ